MQTKEAEDTTLTDVIRVRQESVNLAKGYISEMQRNPAHFTPVTLDLLEAKAMQAMAAALDKGGNGNIKNLKTLMELVMRLREQQIKEENIILRVRALTLRERKQRQLEKTVNDKALSSEEIAARCRVIFKHNGTGTRKQKEIRPSTPLLNDIAS